MGSGRAGRAPGGWEREFHRWLVRSLPAGRTGALPLGDDAAAMRPPGGALVVATTDALIEGTHFLADSPSRRVGRAATSVSLSDLAAKGATPAGVLVALIVPPRTPRTWAEGVVRGAEAAAAEFGAHLVGGDTKSGPVRAVVGVGFGWGDARHLAPRAAARPGDVLVTTGTVGRGGLAYDRARRRRGSRARRLADLLVVHPRVREGVALARSVHAMLDTSDGLAASCRLLAEASRVGAVVDEEALPLAPGFRRLGGPAARRRSIAFFGGDYELLAAVSPARLGRAVRDVEAVGGRLTPIGTVVRGRGAYLRRNGRLTAMPGGGWDPFRRPRLA